MIEYDLTGCWVDLFELSRFRGRRRRLFGPGDLSGIRSQTVEWGISVDSLIVGPAAYVRLYRFDDPQSAGLWLSPRQVAEDLIAAGIDDRIDSLSIHIHAPMPGQPGYEQYSPSPEHSKR